MRRYTIRKGIVLTRVCDTHLLVPSREASEECKGIQRIPFFEVIIWKQLEKGKTYDEILDLTSKFMLCSPEEARPKLDMILDKLVSRGFLIKD